MPEFADSSRARAETPAERHSRWAWIHDTTAMTGWNFTALEGRLIADDPPWDFDQLCLDVLREPWHCLDMGTGGGERLIALVQQAHRIGIVGPNAAGPTISATEGWEGNLELAASALADYDIEVREYDSETGGRLPWPDGEFDLVMNRHESYDIAEVARVLSPGGFFLTQQVDGTEAAEFRSWFGGETSHPDIQLEHCVDEVERHGLNIEAARKWQGSMQFTDVEAVIEYLAYIPWDVPDFNVEDNIRALDRLAGEAEPLTVTQKRFLIAAVKE